MKIIKTVQGSADWHTLRGRIYRTASRAPVMMGESAHQQRNDLLREIASGVTEDIDARKQILFDRGHAAEVAACPLVEAMIGEPLFPTVATDDADYVLASYDGLTMAATIGYECKLWNEALVAAVRASDLPPMYYWQLEQQALIAGLEKIIFVCTDGTPDKFVHMEYRPVPGRAEQLMAGWKQFDEDLANYQPVEVIPAAVAAPTMALPALSIKIEGEIKLIDNLAVFGSGLKEFISKIPPKPSTEQEFADCKEACKRLQEAQDRLEGEKASGLAQVATVDEMVRTVDLYANLARTTRLALEKLVAAREKEIKGEIVQSGKDALVAHIAGLHKQLGKAYPIVPAADFAAAAKNKRTLPSLRDAVDTELARAKIEANAIADRIQINLATMQELARGYDYLFADAGNIVTKDNDDFAALVKMRITEHVAAEVKRLDAEREKIRAEEQAKAEAEQRRKAEQEKAAAQVAPAEGDLSTKARGNVIAPASAAPHSSAPAVTDQREPLPSPRDAGGAGTYIRPEFDAPPWGKLDTRRDDGSPAPALDDILAWMARAFGVTEATAYRWLLDIFRERLAA